MINFIFRDPLPQRSLLDFPEAAYEFQHRHRDSGDAAVADFRSKIQIYSDRYNAAKCLPKQLHPGKFGSYMILLFLDKNFKFIMNA